VRPSNTCNRSKPPRRDPSCYRSHVWRAGTIKPRYIPLKRCADAAKILHSAQSSITVLMLPTSQILSILANQNLLAMGRLLRVTETKKDDIKTSLLTQFKTIPKV
jgi:hypothetical protein